MLLREAIAIILWHASRDVKGAGCGIRTLPSDEQKAKLREACERVWPNVYNRPMDKSDKWNMGV